DRVRHPLRVYAIAEALIGVYVVAFPIFYGNLTELYLDIAPEIGAAPSMRTAVRFAVGVAAFLLPSVAMGVTTPVFARAVSRESVGGAAWLARIYGWNTLGAALGAIASAYLLVPELGLAGSLAAASIVNFSVAGFAFFASKPAPV